MPRLLALLALSAWIIMLSSYPSTAFMAGGVACFTLPLYRRLRARFSRVTSVIAYTTGLSLCVLAPFAILTVLIAPQALNGIRRLTAWKNSGWAISPELSAHIEKVKGWLMEVPGLDNWLAELGDNLNDIINSTVKFLVTGSIGMAGSTVSAIWLVVLFIILTVLAVVYAPALYKVTLRLTKLPEDSLQRFIEALRSAFRVVFIGILLIAAIQGILCGIGFKLMGIAEPAFWGFLAALLAAIPLVGPALIWFPMAIVLWLTGSPYAAVGIAIWCLIVVTASDYLIRPYLLRTGIKAPTFVLLLSILCSIVIFGPIGLIAGPVLVAFAHQAMKESDLLAERKQ